MVNRVKMLDSVVGTSVSDVQNAFDDLVGSLLDNETEDCTHIVYATVVGVKEIHTEIAYVHIMTHSEKANECMIYVSPMLLEGILDSNMRLTDANTSPSGFILETDLQAHPDLVNYGMITNGWGNSFNVYGTIRLNENGHIPEIVDDDADYFLEFTRIDDDDIVTVTLSALNDVNEDYKNELESALHGAAVEGDFDDNPYSDVYLAQQ